MVGTSTYRYGTQAEVRMQKEPEGTSLREQWSQYQRTAVFVSQHGSTAFGAMFLPRGGEAVVIQDCKKGYGIVDWERKWRSLWFTTSTVGFPEAGSVHKPETIVCSNRKVSLVYSSFVFFTGPVHVVAALYLLTANLV